MRDILWPTTSVPDTMPVRLGRVIHWLCFGVAAFWILLIVLALVLDPGPAGVKFDAVVWPIFWSVVLAAIGRGARYVLAGE